MCVCDSIFCTYRISLRLRKKLKLNNNREKHFSYVIQRVLEITGLDG